MSLTRRRIAVFSGRPFFAGGRTAATCKFEKRADNEAHSTGYVPSLVMEASLGRFVVCAASGLPTLVDVDTQSRLSLKP